MYLNFKYRLGVILNNIVIAKWIITTILIVFASLNAENNSKWNNNPTIESNPISVKDISILNMDPYKEKAPHDLSTINNQSEYQKEQCVFCHAQRTENRNTVLWASSKPSTSINSDSNHPQLVSTTTFKCLGCHDGATAVNNLPNGTVGFSFASVDVSTNSTNRSKSAFSYSTDKYQQLGNNHPVGIVYDESNPELNAIADLKIAKLEDGTNKVTCASCHEPHRNTNVSFSTISNKGSSLCLDCHNK